MWSSLHPPVSVVQQTETVSMLRKTFGTVKEIILPCLEKEPQKRYHDGSQLARALETLDFSPSED